MSPREAFEVFQSEMLTTESLEASSDLSPKPNQQHHDLGRANIPAYVRSPNGPTSRGRLERASMSGLVIACPHPLPFRAPVLAEWMAFGGYTMAFAGHVIRTSREDMAIRLVLESEHDRTFLHSFLELARGGGRSLQVTVRQVREEDESMDLAAGARRLEQAWSGLETRFGSDDAHQRFIQTCMRLGRIDFALARYRDAAKRKPTQANAEKYIDQIGKILTFSGFQRNADTRPQPIRAWLWMATLAAALIALAGGLRILTSQTAEGPAPIRSLQTQSTPVD
ncbi:MAG: hypothetical protein ACFB9M_20560 [Myxococcota bacterium]